MSIVKRFRHIAEIVGTLTILGMIALAGGIAYLWWDSRQETHDYDFDTKTESVSEFDSDSEPDSDASAETTEEESPTAETD